MTTSLYYQYWGKASKEDNSYHLLPYHCLDVAAVGYLLLSPDKPLCKKLATQLKVEAEWLRDFFVFCLALHDLGKFSRTFQGLRQDLSPDLVSANPRMSSSEERHDSLGYWVWIKFVQPALTSDFSYCDFSEKEIKTWLKYSESWIEVVTGHHGIPPKKQAKLMGNYFQAEDNQAVLAFVKASFGLFLPNFDFRPLLDKALKKRLQAASWQLAGVAVLADWTGSNQEYFTYHSQPQDLDRYWQKVALPSAQKSIENLPEVIKPSAFTGIQNLFPFIEQPTPLQEYAIKEPLSDQAQLFILEDVTGAGKTEAALTLVHRLMDKGLADGLYVALPTMATSNAMYQRLSKVYNKFYQQQQAKPSLVLAHGARELSESFRESILLSKQSIPDSDYQNGYKEEEQEQSATAYCNAWLADSRKKALLADVGVGTLDQALLAVLPARHQSLRLLGLGRKVLLVDEVHAYDGYMQKLLNALLEAHARQGGSVILLSATLPQAMRASLVDAFHKGLSKETPELIKEKDYPLVTHTPAIKVEQAVDTREDVKRTVKVERLATEQDVLNKIKQAVDAGQCVCWIRNTVKSARQSYQDCLNAGINPAQLSLFHSRFAMGDRQTIEQQTLARFGKDSTPTQRKGQVLIATQVVEQSLDLDFDVMISDLAPIDLLIQRAGRLQRHVRDQDGNRLTEISAQDQRGMPILSLYSPEPLDDTSVDWLKPDHAGTQAVYPHVGQLWLTAKMLLGQTENQFTMPQDARKLIDGVYSSEAEKDIPPELLDASFEAEAKGLVQKSMANLNVLNLSKGYTYSSGDWTEETRIPTRLTEQETVSVALAVWDGEQLKPYIANQQYAWALSTVKLPDYEWEKAQQAIPEKLKPTIETLKEENKALRWLEVFPLISETDTYYTAKDGFIGEIPTDVGNA